MSADKGETGTESLSAKVEQAERRLQEAAGAAGAAEQRATAQIRGLEADLESERLQAAKQLEEQRTGLEKALEEEREARRQVIAAAEGRLAEIEAQAEAAERRVEEAERRATEAEGSGGDAEARAREGAAAWLRGQIEKIRQEAGQQ